MAWGSTLVAGFPLFICGGSAPQFSFGRPLLVVAGWEAPLVLVVGSSLVACVLFSNCDGGCVAPLHCDGKGHFSSFGVQEATLKVVVMGVLFSL